MGRPRVGTIGYLRHEAVDVIQKQNDSTFLGEVNFGGNDEQTALFIGFDVSDLTDDDRVNIDDLVQATRTETYETAIGGTNTVIVIEPVPLTALAPYKNLFIRVGEARRWTIEDENKTVMGFFKGYSRGKVSIVTTDQEDIEVKLNNLSDADQKFVRSELKKRRKKK